MLRGTIRDQVTARRRPFIRFFACEQDFSHEAPDAPLPDAIATGAAPLLIVGDFNVGAEAPEMQPVLASFHDAWADAQRAGRATGNPNSHGALRVDYVFFSPGTSISLDSAEVVNTIALVGVAASDHEPVVASFTVR